MKTVIFACVHSAGRSQMAAAFFNKYVNSKGIKAISAGTEPAVKVHPEVMVVMQEIGIDLSNAKPTLLTEELAKNASLLVTMGCGEKCPYVPGLKIVDWSLQDPKGQGLEQVRIIRNEIEQLVLRLLTEEILMSISIEPHKVVSREEWIAKRLELLAKEKAHMRQGDQIAAERRALPWVMIDKNYRFETATGQKNLGELFGKQPQLIVHHFMFAPEWNAGCPGCSFQAEHIAGPKPHLERHNVQIIAVSRAPIDKILAYKKRMGWDFEWVSSFGSEFNYDFGVSFTKDELASGSINYNFGTIRKDPRYLKTEDLPGLSVFYKNEQGKIFHTYSTYARGLDGLLGTNHYLDLVPEGRNDEAYPNWPKRHDEY